MSALEDIDQIKRKMLNLKIGKFSSVCGRKFAMDRDNHWDHPIKVYKMLVEGKALFAETIQKAITLNYRNGNNDENIAPTLIKNNGKVTTIKANDVIIFYNFRPDRARELTKIFIDPRFRRFFWKPHIPANLYFVTFTQYFRRLNPYVAFPRKPLKNILPSILADFQKKDLRISESEKYAHVSYFFNCGREDPFAFEERRIFSSPDVSSYDKSPAMAGSEITHQLIKAIKSQKYDFILVNFANVDLVAHTGNILAAGKAVMEVDKFLKKIIEETKSINTTTIITADHGNVEQMINIKENRQNNQLTEEETTHTLNPVPFILINQKLRKNLIQGALTASANTLSKIIAAKDNLSDIAPTILELMKIPKPEEMTGHSLLNRLE
ncbi:MAG: 2,3-bisphosphoglycerate-independent phosphoglycerate mutase, partial [Patescibacteria group bacterium]